MHTFRVAALTKNSQANRRTW